MFFRVFVFILISPLLKSALTRTEGDSLLCGGITLMTHFKEQKAYTKPQEVSRNLKFVTNNTTNVCFDFGGRISSFLPMLVGGHEKIKGSIPKILP